MKINHFQILNIFLEVSANILYNGSDDKKIWRKYFDY